MAFYMLDTNFASMLIRGEHNAIETMSKLSDEPFVVSSITAMELHFGLAKAPEKTNLRLRVLEFLESVEVLAFDQRAAHKSGEIRAHLQKVGKPSGIYDPLIAGHALATAAILITNNKKHFVSVPDLKLHTLN